MAFGGETGTLLGAVGMILLGVSWLRRSSQTIRIAQLGWIFVGVYFFLQSWTYLSHDDPILTVLSALTLPMACLAAWWEQTATDRKREAVVWARGTVAFAGGPYLLISYVPYLSILAIWFVASQSAWFLGFATGCLRLKDTWTLRPKPCAEFRYTSVGRPRMRMDICWRIPRTPAHCQQERIHLLST